MTGEEALPSGGSTSLPCTAGLNKTGESFSLALSSLPLPLAKATLLRSRLFFSGSFSGSCWGGCEPAVLRLIVPIIELLAIALVSGSVCFAGFFCSVTSFAPVDSCAPTSASHASCPYFMSTPSGLSSIDGSDRTALAVGEE